ncbi:alpha/beta-hydrolase [Mollisia scopiformis]|uniref:Alpha/beta-hydrolase n=1 Tax=Mollisia scopiformis TaxID=149040 RepID=A0A194XH23_MOLSC|nr:alpha/beta-hydrolase [Mollisia scopiformis]KUJ19072.1 alpha/beta-hydrolase [Mollisia scopiformis]
MILGQVSWLDCFVFLIFLAPQLIWHVGFFPTLFCGLQALPFLVIKLPLSLLYERLLLNREQQSPFVQQASWFEDVIIRCVRYAFAYIPAQIGRVFFSKLVALPFLRFRMLRHGYFKSPIHWQDVKQNDFKGIWIISDPSRKPDVVIYYAHGGGFSMGSSYFYLEFLLAYLSLLKTSTKFQNPAILALEYTLVPDASYPAQLQQAAAGYKYLLSITHDPAQIVFSGDSAGATIILSLLLHIGNKTPKKNASHDQRIQSGIEGVVPGMAVLISPWVTLVSPKDRNTTSDYLDADTLHQFARQYVADKLSIDDPLVSPGNCKDVTWWRNAVPSEGFFFSYGSEEVFAPEIRDLIKELDTVGMHVEYQEADAGIHAWPVASLFLCSTKEKRLRGLQAIVKQISTRIVTHIEE